MPTITEYAILSAAAYNDAKLGVNPTSLPVGWTPLPVPPNPPPPTDVSPTLFSSGFSAQAFTNGNQIVISFKGTDSSDKNKSQQLSDIASDIAIGAGLSSSQIKQAVVYYEKIKNANPDAVISFTGHSLGGGLASVLGDWFGVSVMAFDEAPFKATAVNSDRIEQIRNYLTSKGFDVGNMVSYDPNNPDKYLSQLKLNESKISSDYIYGEILSNFTNEHSNRFINLNNLFVADSNRHPLQVGGGNNVTPTDLHSILLLSALEMSSVLKTDTKNQANLLNLLFSQKLYAAPLDGTVRDFLTILVNSAINAGGTQNANGLLGMFALDIARIGTVGEVMNNLLNSAIISAVIEDYYFRSVGTTKAFINSIANGIEFDLSDIKFNAATGPRATASAQPKLIQAVDFMIYGDDPLGKSIAALANNWFIQSGGSGMSAAGGAFQNDVMIGGGYGNNLVGGDGKNVLLAGAGNDTLAGGAGVNYEQAGFANDILSGRGTGDKYEFITTGPKGKDTIIANGIETGSIWIGQNQLTGAVIAASSDSTPSVYVWIGSASTKYSFAVGGLGTDSGTLTISQGLLGPDDQLVITNFDLNRAMSTDGFLGIKFKPGLAIGTAGSIDPFSGGNFIAQDNAVTAKGVEQNVVIYSSDQSASSRTITLTGGTDGMFIETGGSRIPFSGGSVTLTLLAGQNEVDFGLVYGGVPQVDTTVHLTSTLQTDAAATGGGGASNVLTVTFSGLNSASANLVAMNPYANPFGSVPAESIDGTYYAYNDFIAASQSASVNYLVNAISGGDYISAGNGDNVINGNDAIDFIVVKNGNNKIYAGSQVSDADAIAAESNLIGSGKRGDYIAVGNGNNTIVGGAGNDHIIAGTGDNLIIAGPGDITFIGGAEADDSGLPMNQTQNKSSSAAEDPFIRTAANWIFQWITDPATGIPNGIYNSNFIGGAYGQGPVWTSDYIGDYIGGYQASIGNDTIYGGVGKSVFLLANGDNQFIGQGGDDYVETGTGDNTIFGGSGDDTIRGEGGVNYINLGSGNDSVYMYGGNGSIIGGDGSSIINFNLPDTWTPTHQFGNNYFEAGRGNTTVYGGGGSDTLIGGSGHDDFIAGSGSALIQAGTGDTTIQGGAGDDTLKAGSGSDIIAAGSGDTTIYGSTGTVTIIGGAGNTLIYTGDGGTSSVPTEVDAGDGNTTVYGGDGIYRISGGKGNTEIHLGNGGGGTDDLDFTQVILGAGNSTVYGGDGVDLIQGGAGADVLYAGDGGTAAHNTEVFAGSGATTIFGGAGVDYIKGGSGDDVIHVGDGGSASGPTQISGGTGNETIIAGAGTSNFFGNGGHDDFLLNSDFGSIGIVEASSDDVIEFGPGMGPQDLSVVVEGTTSDGETVTQITTATGQTVTLQGNDAPSIFFDDAGAVTLAQMEQSVFTIGTATYSSVSATLTTYLDIQSARELSATSASSVPIEKLFLTGTDDLSGTGNNINDFIKANSGNDTLTAGAGSDTLVGGSGSTHFVTGTGNVSLIGGSGGSLFTVNTDAGNVVITQTLQSDILQFGDGVAAGDIAAAAMSATDGATVVTLTMKSGNTVTISGSSLGNLLDQVQFADGTVSTLSQLLTQSNPLATSASSGVDVTMSAGATQLTLTGSADLTAHGNDLDDVIVANTGNDTLIGGSGNSTLVAGAGADTFVVGQAGTSTVQGSASKDVLLFADDVTAADLSAQLQVSADGSMAVEIDSDKGGAALVLESWYGTGLDKVLLSDGTSISLNDLITTSNAGASPMLSAASISMLPENIHNIDLIGDANLQLVANDQDDIIGTNAGNDTIFAGSGSDTIISGNGQNTYVVTKNGANLVLSNTNLGDTLVFQNATSDSVTATSETQADGSIDITITADLAETKNIVTFTEGQDQSGLDAVTYSDGSSETLEELLYRSGANGTAIMSGVSTVMGAGVTSLTLTGAANISGTGNNLNDVIKTNTGNDTIFAGSGNDTIISGNGNNNYVVTANGANLVLSNTHLGDTLVFQNTTADHVTANSVTQADGYINIQITADLAGTKNVVTFTDLANQSGMDAIAYSDGSSETLEHLIARSDGDLSISSSVSAVMGQGVSTLILTGTDNISGTGNDLNDNITANSGNDTLISGSGNDTLVGGRGHDVFIGGTGATTYVVSPGSTSDIQKIGAKDVIYYKDTVGSGYINVSKQLDQIGNVIFILNNSSDGSTIQIGASSNGTILGSVKLSDGTLISLSQLLAENPQGMTATSTTDSVTLLPDAYVNLTMSGDGLTATANSQDNYLRAIGNFDTLIGGAGRDTLQASGTQAILIAGSGDTLLMSGGGALLQGGSGSDTLLSSNGDTLVGGQGKTTFEIGAGSALIQNANSSDVLEFASGVLANNGLATNVLAGNVFASTDVIGGDTEIILQTSVPGAGVDVITIADGGIGQVVFSDGSVIAMAQLLQDSYLIGKTLYSKVDVTALPQGTTSLVFVGSADVVTATGASFETINANGGNDSITIGSGGAQINDGAGISKIYVGTNSGNVIEVGGGGDFLEYGAGINSTDLSVAVIKGTNQVFPTVILTDAQGETVTIQDTGDLLNIIKFADGSSTTLSQILAKNPANVISSSTSISNLATSIVSVTLTANGISVTGNALDDTLIAAGDQDIIFGGSAEDVLIANGSNDVLYGYSGKNTLIVATGANAASGTATTTLYGGAGLTTFVINKDSGRSNINASDVDIIQFGSGISHSDLTVTDSTSPNNSAVLQWTITGPDGLTVVINGDQSFRKIYFSDGSSIDIDSLYPAETNDGYTVSAYGSATLSGGATLLQFLGIADVVGNVTIDNAQMNGNGGSDTLSAGGDNDYVTGYGQNNTLIANGDLDSLHVGRSASGSVIDNATFIVNGNSDNVFVETPYSTIIGGGNNENYFINNEGLPLASTIKNYNSTDEVFFANFDPAAIQSITHKIINGVANTVILFHARNASPNVDVSLTLIGDDSLKIALSYGLGDEFTLKQLLLFGVASIQTVDGVVAEGVRNVIAQGSLNLTANSLDDYISVNGFNEFITVGSGNDTISGALGSGNTYIINAGSGATTIVQSNQDTIRFGKGISLGDVDGFYTEDSNEDVVAVLNVKGQNSITIVYPQGIDNVIFDDGSTVSLNSLITVTSDVSIVMDSDSTRLRLTGTADISGTGNKLADTITANSGNDTLIAGSGLATLIGGAGNDTFVINNAADVIIESPNSGNNIEKTSVSVTLADNVESLVGTGSAALTLKGNAGPSSITANSGADTLVAGSGLATMIGGSGNDTFVVNNSADVISVATSKTGYVVQSSVNYVLPANLLNLVGTGSVALTLTGNNLADKITANSGDDTLVSGTGVTTLIGGTGNNTFVVNNASDVVTKAANSGQNTELSSVSVTLAANVQSLAGSGTAAIKLTGSASASVITANSGNDTLVAGTGLATLIGGSGNDTFVINNAGDVIVEAANSGSNTEQTSVSATLAANVQNLTGTGTAALTLTGNTSNGVITANSGNDTLVSGTGIETLVAGSGVDTFVINNSADSITLSAVKAGTVVQSSVNFVLPANLTSVTGIGTAAITLTGNNLADTITANSGNDTLVAGTGLATLIGGAGNNTFVVNNASDVITKATNSGSNTEQSSVSVTLAANVQNLVGTGTAALTLTGNASASVITANSGNDTLVAGNGLATLIGGAGNDTFVINNASDVITEAANSGNNTEQTSVSATLAANVQNLTGTGSAALTLTGNTLDNVITGNAGTDKLVAGSGNDTLVAGTGVATLTGGLGNDTFVVNNTSDVVVAQSGAALNTISSSVTYTAAANVQDLFLTGSAAIKATANTGNDLLIGSSGADTLVGGSGVDVLEAGTGATTLTDTTGAAAIIAGAGNATITASGGADFVRSGAGTDAITLGAGASVVAFNTGDGKTTITAGTGVANTISLGGGIAYSNLAFSKSGNNLMLTTGGANVITFQNWYASTAGQDVTTLQVIEQSASTYSATSTNTLYSSEVETFDFKKLVTAFNAALAATPSITSWSLSGSLLADHLSSSNTAALGGDLAYYEGLNGNLTGLNLATAVSTLQSSTFGKSAQTMDAWSGVSSSNNRLH